MIGVIAGLFELGEAGGFGVEDANQVGHWFSPGEKKAPASGGNLLDLLKLRTLITEERRCREFWAGCLFGGDGLGLKNLNFDPESFGGWCLGLNGYGFKDLSGGLG
ncbi:hypothetical protein ACRZ5O_21250 [Pseudomonas protegens]|uniref:hypothetical protein n=1 Tax=Pseudomonas protegens TaxID=380021 RepID=UPI003FD826F5